MSALVQDFYAELSAIATVSSFAGTRIYPLLARANQNDFIVYTPITGGIPEALYAGDLGLTEQTIQVDVYSRTFAENQTVIEAIITYFNGLTGVINSNTIIGKAMASAKREMMDTSDSTLYRSSVDITFLY